jgi:ketosteroid isomerase-like protein
MRFAPLAAIACVLASCASAAPCPTVTPVGSDHTQAELHTCPNPRVAGACGQIEGFNRALTEAMQHMDNAAILALWEDDGASLLPQTRPVVGKAALSAFLQEVTAKFPGARMRSFEMTCDGAEVTGDYASEYCDEHQVVDLGADKPPFDGRGKMLFVLHRGQDGHWRIRREMWNQGVRPPS